MRLTKWIILLLLPTLLMTGCSISARVKKADKKMYYKVVVQAKKTKELETYWFTNAGKIVE